MTEDEAKTKWCRHVRFTDADGDRWPMTNRGESLLPGDVGLVTCIGSTCMSWRYAEKERLSPGKAAQSSAWIVLRSIDPDTHRAMIEWARADSGFCGADCPP